MEQKLDRTDAAILKVLSTHEGPLGAARICRELATIGIEARPRTIRFRLARLDELGLTACVSRREGRRLLPAGHKELNHVHVVEKLGFVAARIDVLTYQMSFVPQKASGTIIANVATIKRQDLTRALQTVQPVLAAGLGMGNRLALAEQGEVLAGRRIPRGHVGIATVCNVTLNGMMLKQGVPMASRFGCLLEMRNGKPSRFVQLMDYAGTTMDPLEVYIRAGMTRVADCVETGTGIVGASFREVPSVALDAMLACGKEQRSLGLASILVSGQPGQPLLDIPVSEGRTGIIVSGGLNPVAAMFEAGIPLKIEPLSGLEDWSRFRPHEAFRTMARRQSPFVD